MTKFLLASVVMLAACNGKKHEPTPPCPGNYGKVSGNLTCTCGANHSGAVWGSGIYTTGSDICAAAIHAGAIPSAGGEVSFVAAPGCSKYTGDSANGVTTQSWGSFEKSFYITGHGDGKCP
jgi:LCCL domain